eukprot:TRINITY_DN4890_c0_g2_i1.p1 TRINITY_DN4890_c0_g2~~TRINITY_DN4890_c0_g2_i1.p1  ORF type:complete len:186 (+),score=40.40 TRINITY_DN4890_c0_g2_i1:55-612(+)
MSLIAKLNNLRQRAKEVREKRAEIAAAQKEMKREALQAASKAAKMRKRERSLESAERRVLKQKIKEYLTQSGKTGIDLGDPSVPLEIRLSLTDDFCPNDYETLLQLDNAIDRSASPTRIKKLKKIKLTKAEALPTKDTDCQICLSQYTVPATVCELPCGHMFHHSCAEKWLSEYNNFCPLCKTAI